MPFALPGHGVITTRSMAEPMYGSVGCDLLQGGFTGEVLTALSSVDPQKQRRPVAVLGVMAAWPAVWKSMVGRFESSGGRWPSGCSLAVCGRGGRRRLPRTPLRRDHGHPRDHHRASLARRGALAGREDAAREMLGELAGCAPQFLEAARRFGKADLMPAEVVDRILPVG